MHQGGVAVHPAGEGQPSSTVVVAVAAHHPVETALKVVAEILTVGGLPTTGNLNCFQFLLCL